MVTILKIYHPPTLVSEEEAGFGCTYIGLASNGHVFISNVKDDILNTMNGVTCLYKREDSILDGIFFRGELLLCLQFQFLKSTTRQPTRRKRHEVLAIFISYWIGMETHSMPMTEGTRR